MVSVIGFVVWVLILPFGFDLTDEGMYLMSVDNPDRYKQVLSQFSVVFAPWWALVENNVSLYRQSFWITSFVVSFLCFYRALPVWSVGAERLACSFGLSFSTISFLDLWLPTPSYNSGSFLLLIACALLILEMHKRESKVARDIVLFGIYGLIASLLFFLKPPAAVLAILTSLLVLYSKYRVSKVKLGVTIFAIQCLILSLGLLFMSFVAAEGPWNLITNLRSAYVQAQILYADSSSDTLRLLWNGKLAFTKIKSTYLLLALFFTLVCVLAIKVGSKPAANQFRSDRGFSLLLWIVATGMLVIALCSLAFDKNFFPDNTNAYESFLLIWLPLSFVWVVLFASRIFGRKAANHVKSDRIVISVALILLAYAFVFGTSNNYFGFLRLVNLFGLLAVIVLVSSEKNSLLLYVLTCWIVLIGTNVIPKEGKLLYRQPTVSISMLGQGEATNLGRLDGLILPEEVRNYYQLAVEQSKLTGFSQSTPVLDLTGGSAGLIFAIGGRSLGAAWLLGGYLGSDEFAREKLAGVSEEDLRSSWVLVEESSRSISKDVLNIIQKELTTDYTAVATFYVPDGYGSRKSMSKQTLYKPK